MYDCLYLIIFGSGKGLCGGVGVEVAGNRVQEGLQGRENGDHVGRNHVGTFTRTGCLGTSVQVHGLRHHENNYCHVSLTGSFARQRGGRPEVGGPRGGWILLSSLL